MQELAPAKSDATNVGYNVLGPIIHRYFLGLHTYSQYLNSSDTAFLLCARGGVRIKRLFDQCRDASAWPSLNRIDHFWISRVLACKGTFMRARDLSARFICHEFSHATLGDVVRALLRHQPALLQRLELNDAEFRRPSSEFEAWMDESGPAAKIVREYFRACERRLDAYVARLTGGCRKVVLIDTGWQGSTQSLLKRAYPHLDWTGLYFGRILGKQAVVGDAQDMIGIMFENDAYDPRVKESALVFHRHIVEALFEPSGPSIEEVCENDPSSVGARQAEANLLEIVDDQEDALYVGVQRYLKDHAGRLKINEIMSRHRGAILQLHDMVTVPTLNDAIVLRCKERSLDFGRKGTAPVLQLPKSSAYKTPAARINNALWTQGQIALEYSPILAREKQVQLVEDTRSALTMLRADGDHRDDLTVLPEDARSTVAVITRTKNRPILLERAARSVAAQTYPFYVWVVVNDGGEPGPVRDVVEKANIDPRRVVVVDNERSLGMEAASNSGIAACHSDYIVIHDDDDSWEPKFLETAVNFLDDPTKACYGGVITHSVYVSEEIRDDDVVEYGRWPYKNWVRNVHLAEMACDNMFPPIAFLFRRSVYAAVGGFKEELPVLGDWWFNLEFLFKTNIGVVTEPLALYHHRDRGGDREYSNSVIGDISKHEEFNAIVRNQFLRELGDRSPVNLLLAMGYLTKEVRHHSEAIQRTLSGPNRLTSLSGAGKIDDTRQGLWMIDTADLRWAIMQAQANRSIWTRLNPVSKVRRIPHKASWPQLITLVKAARIPIAPPPDFDNAAYLSQYPDVAQVIGEGRFTNGFEHYILYGRDEGRARPFP